MICLSDSDSGAVTGSYSVLQPDCVVRTVQYRADAATGFDVIDVSRTQCSGTRGHRVARGTKCTVRKAIVRD